ncbi:MAG TPA: N-acetylglucosamine-6-phosphate deacetylase [Fimbriimonadaceae bacterium]|nr:N-acetylglucosamine-6-phosphate deacetylase [Fimbriimonadaceae bacterium]
MTGSFDALGPNGFGVYEVDLSAPAPRFSRVSTPPKGLLIPGFVDIHIHGAFGIDFMSASTEDMEALCRKLEKVGYEGFLPTTITGSAESISQALERLPIDSMILGFHLEGPFISPTFPGAQPPSFILNPPGERSEWDAILLDPRLKVVTLAPEIPGALELTSRLMKRGVIVSMGHTNSTYDEARRGFEFGASHTTHTYNAMRGLHHREAGTVGYALLNDSLTCELIYDRLHVSREAARLLVKCKPPDRLIAVSDSTLATGLPPNQKVTMWGLECVIGRREVRLASNNALAGSAITLLDAFRNLHQDFGPEVAIRACCLNPRRALQIPDVRKWLILDRESLEIMDTVWI